MVIMDYFIIFMDFLTKLKNMLRLTHISSEFRCDIAEKAIEMIKEAFGNKLYIFNKVNNYNNRKKRS